MELIVLLIAAVIWMVIKSLSQPPRPEDLPEYEGQGRWSRGQEVPDQQQPDRELPGDALKGKTYFAEQSEEQLEVVDLDKPAAVPEVISGLVQKKTIVQGVIFSEILGPPRAKKPHRVPGGR